MTLTVRIATRRSPLALWQAQHVGQALQGVHDGLTVELVHITTRGDVVLDAPLHRFGGKGLFVKELEQGILEGRADIAVHSMKDVPAELPQGLHMGAILPRADPHDAFVSPAYERLPTLPSGARVGTCSLRRRCQLLARRPDLNISELRGNVGTRLQRLDEGVFDAIVLAAAGLTRLGMEKRIRHRLEPAISLPAIGQGAIGVECRCDDEKINTLLAPLHDPPSGLRIRAERAVAACLGGGCQLPIAAFAELAGHRLHLRALVGSPDGTRLVRSETDGKATDAEALGHALGERLLNEGAAEILASMEDTGQAGTP